MCKQQLLQSCTGHRTLNGFLLPRIANPAARCLPRRVRNGAEGKLALAIPLRRRARWRLEQNACMVQALSSDTLEQDRVVKWQGQQAVVAQGQQ